MQKLNPGIEYRSNEYYEQLYGRDAVITRLGKITIVHLDRPGQTEIQRRSKEVMREDISGEVLDDDCPLCRELRDQPCDVVYFG